MNLPICCKKSNEKCLFSKIIFSDEIEGMGWFSLQIVDYNILA